MKPPWKPTKEQKAVYWKTASGKLGFKTSRCEQNKQRRIKHGEIIARIKDTPCMDCGGRFHFSQMEFDHRPGTNKEMAIGRNIGAKLTRLLTEIEKCDIVCANCHAYRTWERIQEKKAT
jgi:hypothetical protein